MDAKFENIVENWINGNRGDVRKMVNALSSNEQYQFHQWLKHRFTLEWVEKSDLFNLVCFIAFA